MKGNSSIDEDNLWTPQLEKLFIDIMLKEINKGNMADRQFSFDTWKKILATLNELGKRNFTMIQFKGKFNRMRLLHHEFSTFINQTGFGWDAETNTVHAFEESWQNYCRVNIVEYNTMFYFETLSPIIFFFLLDVFICLRTSQGKDVSNQRTFKL